MNFIYSFFYKRERCIENPMVKNLLIDLRKTEQSNYVSPRDAILNEIKCKPILNQVETVVKYDNSWYMFLREIESWKFTQSTETIKYVSERDAILNEIKSRPKLKHVETVVKCDNSWYIFLRKIESWKFRYYVFYKKYINPRDALLNEIKRSHKLKHVRKYIRKRHFKK